jgi:hypothetical protein
MRGRDDPADQDLMTDPDDRPRRTTTDHDD